MTSSKKVSLQKPAAENVLSASVGDREVQMDRRWKNRRKEDGPATDALGTDAAGTDCVDDNLTEAAEDQVLEYKPPRRKKQRRRQIDPTTCERDYNEEELNFMRALDDYKRSSGRMFPTCSEILEVVRGLGYSKLTEEEQQILDCIHDVEKELADVTEGSNYVGCTEDEESLI